MSLVYGEKPVIREFLKLNKNILIAFAVSITISAFVAQALVEQEESEIKQVKKGHRKR